MKRGRLLRKKRPLPGMPRSGAHRLDTPQPFPNHFQQVPIYSNRFYIYNSIEFLFTYNFYFPKKYLKKIDGDLNKKTTFSLHKIRYCLIFAVNKKHLYIPYHLKNLDI